MKQPFSRGKKSYAKPKNTKGTILRLLKYISGYKWQCIVALCGILLSSGAGVAGTYFLKPAIESIVLHKDVTKLIEVLVIMACIYVAGVVGSYTYSYIMRTISMGTMKKIRVDLFNHMQKLPVSFYDGHTNGQLMSLYTNDTDIMREMISQSLPQFISSFLTVVGVFVMMIVLSWQLTILVIFMLVVMLFVVKKVGGKSAQYFKKQQEKLGNVNGYIEEMIEGQKVVKVFCHEKSINEEFDRRNGELCDAAAKANTFANILMPIMGNLSYVHYALTAAFGGMLALSMAEPVAFLGTLGSFLQYTRSFSQPITQISQQINSVLSALAGAERVFSALDEEVEEDNGKVTMVYAREENGVLCESDVFTSVWAWKVPTDNGFEYVRLCGDVRFENVVFGYRPERDVLKNISLYAKPGQKIAFVGSTGAGKTTITNLINRFFDIKSGKILYDGIDIRDIKKSDLRHTLSMVLQDTHLFTGTVMDNIRYGRLDATDEEVIEAAKIANADSFISHLPNGYNTMITDDGENLSQGQRQLLAIARAAVANPPVLILDEATSSIDTRTEALIEKGMDKLMEGKTVFVIAHRLSTVRNSNAIMVIERGRIIERGDHDNLYAQKGRYYQLYTGMFELT